MERCSQPRERMVISFCWRQRRAIPSLKNRGTSPALYTPLPLTTVGGIWPLVTPTAPFIYFAFRSIPLHVRNYTPPVRHLSNFAGPLEGVAEVRSCKKSNVRTVHSKS